MTQTEKRLRALEREVARLRLEQQSAPPPSYYDIAKERCQRYWEDNKDPWSGWGVYSECMEIARSAFKTKRNCCKCRYQPRDYITTMEDVDEFCLLFQRFLRVYLEYQKEGRRAW